MVFRYSLVYSTGGEGISHNPGIQSPLGSHRYPWTSPDLWWRDSNTALVLKSMPDLSMRSVGEQVIGTGHAIIGTPPNRAMHYWGELWNSCHLLQAQVWLRKCSRSSWWGMELSVLRQVLNMQRRKLSVSHKWDKHRILTLPEADPVAAFDAKIHFWESNIFNYPPCCSQKHTSSQCFMLYFLPEFCTRALFF